MGSMPSVANVVVIPRNGYANRLQAWAVRPSLLKRALLSGCWERACPADASSLFRSAGQGSTFISSDEVEASSVGPMRECPTI